MHSTYCLIITIYYIGVLEITIKKELHFRNSYKYYDPGSAFLGLKAVVSYASQLIQFKNKNCLTISIYLRFLNCI